MPFSMGGILEQYGLIDEVAVEDRQAGAADRAGLVPDFAFDDVGNDHALEVEAVHCLDGGLHQAMADPGREAAVDDGSGKVDDRGGGDDGLGEGTDSRLSFTLPEDGGYVLRASPLGSDGEGLYALELIDRGPQPLPGSVLIGATARGNLTESDATAEDNSFYDAYRVTLKADEKLVITMVSNEVDSFVIVGRPQDDWGVLQIGHDFEHARNLKRVPEIAR